MKLPVILESNNEKIPPFSGLYCKFELLVNALTNYI
jgi:hypothetical protein